MNPTEFADAIAGFKTLPTILIHPVALGLPVFEIVLGLCVMVPIAKFCRLGALGLIVVNLGFTLLLAIAWMRGLSVECGCFGVSFFSPSQWTLQIAIVRDLVFLAMACVVYMKVIRSADGSRVSMFN